MTPTVKKWLCLPNFFPPFCLKMLLFSKKLSNGGIFKPSFHIIKVIFTFVARRPFPFKRDLSPRNGFLPFSRKIQLFLKKLLNNKIFSTEFVIEKDMLIFGSTPLLSLKNR